MTLFSARIALCILLLVSASALASPKADVEAAMRKALAADSYHISMTISGPGAMTIEADFVAPDRLRMQMPMGTQIIIGNTMYMDMQGRSMQVPMPEGTLTKWRDPGNIAKYQATMTVQALGAEAVDGRPAKKYRIDNTQPQPSTSTIWIGADGYPLQVEASSSAQGETVTTVIRYSRFNDPTIRIDPP